MKRHKRMLMVLAVVLIFAVGLTCCSKKEAAMEGYTGGEMSDKSLAGAPAMTEEFAPEAMPPAPSTEMSTTPTTVPEPTTKKLKIIKTADITIEVKNFNDSLNTVRGILKEVAPREEDGLIADTTESKSESGATSGTITIRISPDKFDLLIDKVLTVGDVKYQKISGQDVTKEYYDLAARLASKQEMEKRLIQLLATRTNSVADLLEVERELGRVREDIESIQGTISSPR